MAEDKGAQSQWHPPAPPQLPLIDPTKNVLDLVAAESRYRDSMRVADDKFQTMMRRKDFQFQVALREAEIRRQDDLYRMRSEFDRWRDDLLRRQVADNQASHSTRLVVLEQSRNELAGKASGVASVFGYIAMFATVAVAVAALLVKFTGHP